MELQATVYCNVTFCPVGEASSELLSASAKGKATIRYVVLMFFR